MSSDSSGDADSYSKNGLNEKEGTKIFKNIDLNLSIDFLVIFL